MDRGRPRDGGVGHKILRVALNYQSCPGLSFMPRSGIWASSLITHILIGLEAQFFANYLHLHLHSTCVHAAKALIRRSGCTGSFGSVLLADVISTKTHLTLNAPITTKVVCFTRLLKCLRRLYGKQCDPEQTAPIGAVCSGSTLFASILNSSVMLGNYLQQTTLTDDISRYVFLLGA